MIKNIQKIFSNFINSINGLKIVLKEHSFKAEITIGIALIPFLRFLQYKFFFGADEIYTDSLF